MADSAGRGYEIPRTISHYNVGSAIGGGGMGTVYAGTDRRDDSPVAIKLLHPHLAEDESFRERFEREAHVGALMRSPYVVRLLDYGFAESRYYIVMEYVEGSDLKREIAKGPLAPLRAVKIAAQVGRALEEAEARGVVHRDIKPDNILLTPGDHVKVADFGIAKQLSAGTLTMPGAFVGTLYYAAPELALGKADHRSDVYSLGATLFHALTGHPPFRGDALEVLRHHSETPIPVDDLANVPEVVREIIVKCLQKDPDQRYQTTNTLAGELEKAASRLTQEQKQSETMVSPPPPVVTPRPEQLIAPTEVSSTPPVPIAPTPEPAIPAPAPPPITTGQSQGGGPPKPVPQTRRSGMPSWVPAVGGTLVVGGLALAALLFLGNLGGSDDGGSGPGEQETIGRDALRRMLPSQFDLGPEFTGFALNPDASGYVSAAIPGAACAVPGTATPKPKPIESYNNQYEFESALAVESGTFMLVEAVDNHPDEDAVGDALDDFIADPASVMTMPGCPENEILSEDSFEPEGLPDDNGTGVEQRIKQTDSEGETREFSVTAIGLTRETIVGKVLIAYFDSTTTVEQQRTSATNIAIQLDARIKAVLAENNTPAPSPRPSRTAFGSGSPGESPAPTDTPGPGETAGPVATQGAPGAPIISGLGCSPASAQTGQTVSCSPSIAGGVTSRAWSANGGSPGSGTGASFSTSFGAGGSKSITLTACNTAGCSTASQGIAVSSPATPPPSAPGISGLGCSPSTVNVGQTVNCSPSTSGTVTSYGWSASGGSPGSGAGGSFSTSFGSSGEFVISLQACNGGACSSASQGISVSAPLPATYDIYIDSAVVFFGDSATLFLYADVPASGLGFYDIDIVYDPSIMFASSCDDFYGICDTNFDFDTVNFNGYAGNSGELVIGSVTFTTDATGYSDVFVFPYTVEDINGNDVIGDTFTYHGSVTVQ